MQNTDIFQQYDMVVSLTQRSINDQLVHLTRLGTIPSELVIAARRVDGSWEYTALDSIDDVPKDAAGKPVVSCICGQIVPSIDITDDPRIISLALGFRSGKAYLWQGFGPDAHLQEYDMSGWRYVINVDVGFAQMAKDGLTGKTVPDVVKEQLTRFSDDMFSVSHLFLDLETIDLMRPDSGKTNAGEAGDVGVDQFITFISHYLDGLKKKGNPFILGYVLVTSDSTKYESGVVVPNSMKPVGATFSVFHDATNPDLSTLNFVIATKGGHHAVPLEAPPSFATNWITPSDQCDGKMIYSRACLLEQLVVRPFFEQLRTQVYAKFSGQVDVGIGDDYDKAKSATANGLEFHISEVVDGDDRYQNHFTVTFDNQRGAAVLRLGGRIYLYKKVSKDLVVTSAEAWASGFVEWSGELVLTASKNASGHADLAVSRVFRIDRSGHDSHKNDAAKALDGFCKFAGIILDVFTLTLDNGFFEKLFDEQLAVDIPGLGNLGAAFSSFGSAISTMLMLPAGSVFFFEEVGTDPEGNLGLLLLFKTDSNPPAPPPDPLSIAIGTVVGADGRILLERSAVRASPAPRAELSHGADDPALSAPSAVDSVSVAGKGPLQGSRIDLSIACEFMKNHLPAASLTPGRNIAAAQDDRGRLLLFAVDDADRLFILVTDDSPTGWKNVDLSAGLPGYSGIQRIAVTQDGAGRISLAVAAARPQALGHDILVALMLPGDSRYDWTKLSWHKLDGVDPQFLAETLYLGTSDDDAPPLLIAGGSIDRRKCYIQASGYQRAQQMRYPEDVNSDPDALTAISTGYAFGQRAIFFLYQIGESQSLVCTTLPDSSEGALHYDYSPGNSDLPADLSSARYGCFAIATRGGRDPFSVSSDLYIGTDKGLFVVEGARSSGARKVTDRLRDIHEIIVRDDGQTISLWAVCSPSRLYYLRGQRGEQIVWSAPILFDPSVLHISPIRSRVRRANEMIVVGQDLGVRHCWQDPSSSAWQQRLVKRPGQNFVIDVPSFTTRIHVEDANGRPLGGQSVRVSASEWTYATINGLVYSLDRDNPAEISLDGLGELTIILCAHDVAPPVLHVECAVFDETLDIYPHGKVLRGLSAVRSADGLAGARTADGGAVVDPSIPTSTLSGVAENVRQLTDAARSGPVPSGGSTFVVVNTGGRSDRSELAFRDLPDGFAVGMKREGNVWRLHSGPAATASVSRDIFGGLADLVGDVLHELEAAFTAGIEAIEEGVAHLADGVSFCIQKCADGLMFVLTHPDRVINVVLKSLLCVCKVLNSILKLVGVDLEKLLAWLGYIFDWKDIWRTHKALSALCRSAVDDLAGRVDDELDHWRASIDEHLGGLGEKVRAVALPPDLAASKLYSGLPGRGSRHKLAFHSPATQLAFYHLQHGALLSGLAASAGADALYRFVTDVVLPTVTAAIDAIKRDLHDGARLMADFTTLTVKDALGLAADLVDTIIAPLKALLEGFLTCLKDVVADIRSSLAEPFDIPFLSDLYRFAAECAGDDGKLTALTAVCLVLAIPVTVMFKAADGQPPFPGGDAGFDAPDLFGRLLGSAPETLSFSASDGLPWVSRVLSVVGVFGCASAFVCSLLSIAELAVDKTPDADKLPTIRRWLKAATIAKVVFTFPCPYPYPSGQKHTAWILRLISWGVSAFKDFLDFYIEEAQAHGCVVYLADTCVLGLALAADALALENPSVFVLDGVSNVNGLFYGGGVAFEQEEVVSTSNALSVCIIVGGMIFSFANVIEGSPDGVYAIVNIGG